MIAAETAKTAATLLTCGRDAPAFPEARCWEQKEQWRVCNRCAPVRLCDCLLEVGARWGWVAGSVSVLACFVRGVLVASYECLLCARMPPLVPLKVRPIVEPVGDFKLLLSKLGAALGREE
jgi:hypothetical protein